jgi:hypothetical protein
MLHALVEVRPIGFDRTEIDTRCCIRPAATTRRISNRRVGFLPLRPPSSAGLRFERGVHAARLSRSVLSVPFQSSIRAWMLSHAARRARSSLCGESPTRFSSSSRPIGP